MHAAGPRASIQARGEGMQDALRTLLAISLALTCACQSEAPPPPMDTAKADTFPGEASRSVAETRLPDDASVEPMGETQGSREPDVGQRSSEARPGSLLSPTSLTSRRTRPYHRPVSLLRALR